MKSEITLKLFKENVSRWIDDLSSTKAQQIKSIEVLSKIYQQQKYLNGSNSYREAIGQAEPFLIYQESVEKLSSQIPKRFDGSKMR